MPSSGSPKKSKSNSEGKHTAAGRRLISAAKQMLAHARGEISLPMRMYPSPQRVNVHAIREKMGLSQSAFARKYGLGLRAVQEWEQGRRQPEAAVRAYLTVIAREPEAVVRALDAEQKVMYARG
jgi:putative transcriptional regulator